MKIRSNRKVFKMRFINRDLERAFHFIIVCSFKMIYSYLFLIIFRNLKFFIVQRKRKWYILTVILLHNVARFALGVLFELVQPKVCQFYDPSRVHQTVGRTQRAVIFYDGIVQIDHALKSKRK